MHPLSRLSLARQLFALQVAVALVVVAVGAGLAYADARRDSRAQAQEQVLAVARSVADSGAVTAALGSDDPSAALQPVAERVRRDTGLDFVVVMRTDGTRLTHPDPRLIGGRYAGTVAPAVAGRTVTEVFRGSLGPSVRAVAPVEQGGRVVALVSAGITLTRVGDELLRQLPAVALVSALALCLAAAGAALVSRRLRRQTLGLEPAEITRMYEAHDAVLHAVRDGLLVLDEDRRLQLVNDEAVRLLRLPGDAQGRPVAELALPGPLAELLGSGRRTEGEVHLAGERVLLVEQAPAVRDGRVLGTVTTLRDTTELQEVTGELDSVRGLADALRSQAHEAANRLHTVLTLVELGRVEEAVELGVAELRASQALTDRVLSSVEEPVLAALLLGKAAVASERGIELVVSDDTALPRLAVEARDLVTVVGNLVDNALDAALAAPPPRRVEVGVHVEGADLVVRVADSGAGLPDEQRALAFTRGWSTKPDTSLHGRGLGLALVRQVVDRLGGSVELASGPGAVFTVVVPGAVR